MAKVSAYETYWLQLLASPEKKLVMQIPRSYHARIKKAIIKRKYQSTAGIPYRLVTTTESIPSKPEHIVLTFKLVLWLQHTI